MKRRSLILSFAALTMAGFVMTEPAMAAPETAEAPPVATWVTMTGVGLPVFVDGRVRNHVFVEMKLHLKPGFAPEQARLKDRIMRDALIREGHRRSFGMAHDWNRLDERTLSAAVLQIANQQLGAGNVLRVEIARQTPRMRVRNPPPPATASRS